MTSLCCRSIQSIRNDRTLGPTDVSLPTDAFHVVHMWSELLNEAESRQTYQGNKFSTPEFWLASMAEHPEWSAFL